MEIFSKLGKENFVTNVVIILELKNKLHLLMTLIDNKPEVTFKMQGILKQALHVPSIDESVTMDFSKSLGNKTRKTTNGEIQGKDTVADSL